MKYAKVASISYFSDFDGSIENEEFFIAMVVCLQVLYSMIWHGLLILKKLPTMTTVIILRVLIEG